MGVALASRSGQRTGDGMSFPDAVGRGPPLSTARRRR
jgi:hypothetical protein